MVGTTIRFVTCLLLAAGMAFSWTATVKAQLVEEDDSEVIVSGQDRRFDREIPDLTETARIMVKRTNTFRAHQGLASVARNDSLDEAARYFAQFMARIGKLGHTVDGQRPTERAREHGYQPCIIGENIGWQFSTSSFTARELAGEFLQGWKGSEDHRERMVDPDVTEIGLAVAYSEDNGHFYAVQMFGRPESQRIDIHIVNRLATEMQYELNDKPYWLPESQIRTHGRCRPTEVTFHLLNDDPEMRQRTFGVRREARFIVARNAFGNAIVQRERGPRRDIGQSPETQR
jgi:uncharacterized protein YkwD